MSGRRIVLRIGVTIVMLGRLFSYWRVEAAPRCGHRLIAAVCLLGWRVYEIGPKMAGVARHVRRRPATAPGATTRVAFGLWPTAWPLLRGHKLTAPVGQH